MRREIEFPTTDDGETIDILEFPHSGLYSLPDRQLIKKIEWFSLGSAVKTSADLVDLVRVNVTGRGGALKFYTNFDEVKSYRVEDLLKHFSHHLFREFTIANYHHRWIGKIDFVSDKVILKTSERQLLGKKLGYWEEYQFDFSTGEIESMKIHAEGLIIRIAVLGTAIVLASCMLVWWFRRRRRTAKQGSSANL